MAGIYFPTANCRLPAEKRLTLLLSPDLADDVSETERKVVAAIATENTDGQIISLVNDAMKLSPPLQAHDIARSHRLGAPREGGRPRPIIVRFVSDKARDAVYRARSGLKVYNSQNREAPVFVNDDLTNRRAKLAFDCRKLKKEKKIADTWTYNGKVVVKDLTGKISEVGGPAALLKL